MGGSSRNFAFWKAFVATLIKLLCVAVIQVEKFFFVSSCIITLQYSSERASRAARCANSYGSRPVQSLSLICSDCCRRCAHWCGRVGTTDYLLGMSPRERSALAVHFWSHAVVHAVSAPCSHLSSQWLTSCIIRQHFMHV